MARRLRAYEMGIVIGNMERGRYNAITDVEGVGVGHSTIIEGENIRTGVTAIVPHRSNPYTEKVRAAVYVYNGYGKSIGLEQVRHFGVIETPILSTDTLNVWTVADALLDYMHEEYGVPPDMSVNPVVGETNGSFLNDSYGRHVKKKHVFEAINKARSSEGTGPVEEGNVGGGTPMWGYGFKGGIGTASRKTEFFTLGVLVQLNLGQRQDLIINGVPVGKEINNLNPVGGRPKSNSIMIYIATDLKLTSRQLWKVAKRAIIGLARTGHYGGVTSGDYVIAFSTGKRDVEELYAHEFQRRKSRRPFITEDLMPKIGEIWLNPVYRATVEATEEAIINAMFKAETMVGRDGNTLFEIPLDQVEEIMKKYNRL